MGEGSARDQLGERDRGVLDRAEIPSAAVNDRWLIERTLGASSGGPNARTDATWTSLDGRLAAVVVGDWLIETELETFNERILDLGSGSALTRSAALFGQNTLRYIAAVWDLSSSLRVITGSFDEAPVELASFESDTAWTATVRIEASADGRVFVVLYNDRALCAYDVDGVAWRLLEEATSQANAAPFVVLDREHIIVARAASLDLIDLVSDSIESIAVDPPLEAVTLRVVGPHRVALSGRSPDGVATWVFDRRSRSIDPWSALVGERTIEFIGDDVAVLRDASRTSHLVDTRSKRWLRELEQIFYDPIHASLERVVFWGHSSIRWVSTDESDPTIYGPDYTEVCGLFVSDNGDVVAQHTDGCLRAWSSAGSPPITSERDTLARRAPALIDTCDGGATAVLLDRAYSRDTPPRLYGWAAADGSFVERWSIELPRVELDSVRCNSDASTIVYLAPSGRGFWIHRGWHSAEPFEFDLGVDIDADVVWRVFDDQTIEYVDTTRRWIRWQYSERGLIECARETLGEGAERPMDLARPRLFLSRDWTAYRDHDFARDAALFALILSNSISVMIEQDETIWDSSNTALALPPCTYFTKVALSPSGRFLAIGTAQGTVIVLRRAA